MHIKFSCMETLSNPKLYQLCKLLFPWPLLHKYLLTESNKNLIFYFCCTLSNFFCPECFASQSTSSTARRDPSPSRNRRSVSHILISYSTSHSHSPFHHSSMISHVLESMRNTYGTLPRDKLKFMLAVLDCDVKLLRSQGKVTS